MKGEHLGYKYGLDLKYQRLVENYSRLESRLSVIRVEQLVNVSRRNIECYDNYSNELPPGESMREHGQIFVRNGTRCDSTMFLNNHYFPNKRNLT